METPLSTMAAQTPACTVNPPETKRRLTCSQLRGALSRLPQVPSTGQRMSQVKCAAAMSVVPAKSRGERDGKCRLR